MQVRRECRQHCSTARLVLLRDFVIRVRFPEAEHKRLLAVIGCLQKIQYAIKAPLQPASMLEAEVPGSSGNDTARTVVQPATLRSDG